MIKPISPEEQARRMAHIKQWEASGQSQTAYCQLHRINRSSFCEWLKRMRPSSTTLPSSSIKPIPVIKASSLTPNTIHWAGMRLAHSSGWQLMLPETFSVHDLGTLLRQLT